MSWPHVVRINPKDEPSTAKIYANKLWADKTIAVPVRLVRGDQILADTERVHDGEHIDLLKD